jgi:type III pantothenate kinase
MIPDVVVDVGNTRIKWGWCSESGLRETVALPAEMPDVWEEQRRTWGLLAPACWVVASVHPARRDRLVGWLHDQGDEVRVLESADLPLVVRLEHPDRAGIDRLLDGVAANRRRRPGHPAVVIDAGSAVTVDWLDEEGSFRGGAILPGLRLMAQALHSYTALLPLIDPPTALPPMPGLDTRGAMAAGVFQSVAGGILALVQQLTALSEQEADVFLTGGDGLALHAALAVQLPQIELWPTMTLEGIRFAVTREELFR